RMARPAAAAKTLDEIAAWRSECPDLVLRSTFIVGYPGETDEEFAGLMQFVEDLQFDRVGAFTYSYEMGTPSATLPNHVDDAVKQARYEQLMELQQNISLSKNQSFVGKTLDVLVEGHGVAEDEDGNDMGQTISVGRSYRDAPEIDGYVLVEGELPVGEIVPVRITGATTYDLIATPDTQPAQVIQPGQVFGAGMINLDEING
ncbi:MAG: TRAM domain-containing protein, partial [Aggregatilineales bacterium]